MPRWGILCIPQKFHTNHYFDPPRAIADMQLPDGGLCLNRANDSAGQQVIHAEWEAFAIGKKQGPSDPREHSKIQGRLDS